jgi:hypothetical protein
MTQAIRIYVCVVISLIHITLVCGQSQSVDVTLPLAQNATLVWAQTSTRTIEYKLSLPASQGVQVVVIDIDADPYGYIKGNSSAGFSTVSPFMRVDVEVEEFRTRLGPDCKSLATVVLLCVRVCVCSICICHSPSLLS